MQKTQIHNFQDPFNAGQMVGMLVMLNFIERNNGIPETVLDEIKNTAANNLEIYFQQPAEDIHLMINNIVNEIGKL